MVTKRDNSAFIAGFCILIVISVSIAACTTSNSGTNNPVTTPDNPTTASDQKLPEPVSLTINSAEKLSKLNNLNPLSGNIFLVLNITVKNIDVQKGFVFLNKSVTLLDIKNGKFVPTSLNANPHIQKNLTNPIIPPIRIKENENITGQIVFVITDSTEYQLNLTDIDTKVVSSRYINFENSTPTRNPVSLTINSARKMARVNQDGMHVRDGTIFVVLDITVKNNDVRDGFEFANISTTLFDPERGNGINRSSNFLEKMDKTLENPIILPTKIAQNEAITGQIIFRIYDSTGYRLNLFDSDKNLVTSVPVSFDSLTTASNPVSVTVHSVEKKYTLINTRSAPGEGIVILNMTVKNNDLPEGFYFSEGSTTLRDLVTGRNVGFSFNEKKDYGNEGIENAFILPRKIKQNESITGKLVFATTNSDTYLLNLVDTNNTILLSRKINAG